MASTGLLALAASAYADPEGPFLNTDIGVSFLQNFPSGFTTDPGVRFSLAPGYRIYSDDSFEVSLQLETGLIWNSYKWHSGFSSAQGDMYQVPVMAGFEYAFHAGKVVVPYIGVAGGGVYNDREVSGGTLFVNQNGSASSFDGGVQGMAGVRFRLSDHADLGVGYKFLATFPSGIDYLGTHAVSLTFVWHF